MNVKDLITKEPQLIDPEISIREAARLMSEKDVGSLFIHKNDKLIGVVTDRDIVTRALAEGKDQNAQVQDIMSEKVLYCFDSDSLDSIKTNLEDNQIRRLAVLNNDKRLVGIISMADFEKNFQKTFADKNDGDSSGKKFEQKSCDLGEIKFNQQSGSLGERKFDQQDEKKFGEKKFNNQAEKSMREKKFEQGGYYDKGFAERKFKPKGYEFKDFSGNKPDSIKKNQTHTKPFQPK